MQGSPDPERLARRPDDDDDKPDVEGHRVQGPERTYGPEGEGLNPEPDDSGDGDDEHGLRL